MYENGYIYEASSNTGIDKAVAEELAKRSGCKFEFTVRPRARIWYELEHGDLMMTGSAIQTDERDKFSWAVRYMAQKNYVLIKNTLAAHSAEQFSADHSLTWGVVRSYKHGKMADAFLNSLRKQSRIREDSDLSEVFRLFSTGQSTSAIFATPPSYAKYVKDLKLTGIVRIEDWFPEDPPIPHSLIFSKKFFSKEEINKWRDIVVQMRNDGTLRSIYTKYVGANGADRMLQYKPN